MASISFFFVLAAVGVHHGTALIDCRDPPFSSKIFLDLPELQMLSVENTGYIQIPTKCATANGSSTCANQLCCGDEVGCCFHDADSGRHSCGCKDKGDLKCTRSAPLAVIPNFGCEPHKMGEISMCFRKVRKEESSQSSISAHIGNNKDSNLVGLLGLVISPTVTGLEETAGKYKGLINGPSRRHFLDELEPCNLLSDVRTDVLDTLVEQIIERRNTGLPYGQPTLKNN